MSLHPHAFLGTYQLRIDNHGMACVRIGNGAGVERFYSAAFRSQWRTSVSIRLGIHFLCHKDAESVSVSDSLGLPLKSHRTSFLHFSWISLHELKKRRGTATGTWDLQP